MNILIINTTYHGGGASRVARQLYDGMSSYGWQTYFCSGLDALPASDKQYGCTIYHTPAQKKYLEFYNGVFPKCQILNPFSFCTILKFVLRHHIDLIHIQNMHGAYIGIVDIWLLSQIRPCVATMHDMWNLTGNCVHARSCAGYQRDCRNCREEATVHPAFFEKSSTLLNLKKHFLASSGISYVTPAVWLGKSARRSILQKNKIFLIHNGVNLAHFQCHSKKILRKQYQLSSEYKYIVFLSHDTADRKKGLPYLLDALASLSHPEEYVLLIAGKKMKNVSLSRQYKIVDFGYLTEDSKLNELYSLGDIFVIPSLEDTFPCTVIESLASGTPVVGFATGGITEQVNEHTGFLTADKSSTALKAAIQEAFRDPSRLASMSSSCRQRAIALYDEQQMLQKYDTLYRKILSKQKNF